MGNVVVRIDLVVQKKEAIGMRWFVWLLFLVIVTGCGDGLIPVAGSVQWNSLPVEKGTIRFEPVDKQGPSAEAIIENGRYSVRMTPGKKLVRIYSFVEKSRRYPFGEAAGPAIDYRQVIPMEFNDQTTLITEITQKTQFNFER